MTGPRSDLLEDTYRARTPGSAALHDDARRYFPGGATRSVALYQPYPVYIAEGCGDLVRDVDGNWYLDHLGNFGSMIHGHAHPIIVGAINEQVARGTDFGSPTELHIAMARELTRRVPSIERLRFTTSGTEAVLYAIRAARAFTSKTKILKFEGSYHGGYDSVSVSVDPGANARAWPLGAPSSSGLPPDVVEQTLVAPFNDLARATDIIVAHRAELAAVIVEPVTVRGMIPADVDFLHGVRDLTRDLGIVLIADEVVTLRLAFGGAQAMFDIVPDLTTLGKIIGGGLPVGAIGGRGDVMAGFDPASARPVHHSGTFAGNAATMAAGLAALALLTDAEIQRINALGDRLRAALGDAAAAAGVAAQVTGLGSLVGVHFAGQPVRDYRSALRGDRALAARLHLALLNRGIYARAGGSFFLSTPMGEPEINETVTAFREALIACVRT
jgi:glutamate-1-semialdehyde 2,1-aminomutase